MLLVQVGSQNNSKTNWPVTVSRLSSSTERSQARRSLRHVCCAAETTHGAMARAQAGGQGGERTRGAREGVSEQIPSHFMALRTKHMTTQLTLRPQPGRLAYHSPPHAVAGNNTNAVSADEKSHLTKYLTSSQRSCHCSACMPAGTARAKRFPGFARQVDSEADQERGFFRRYVAWYALQRHIGRDDGV